jgi:DNA-binding response OmpR family regulator
MLHPEQTVEVAPATHEREIKVLLVEDDVSLHPLWRKIFSMSRHPLKVEWTNRAEDAESLIRMRYRGGKPFDLVIADIFLDGSETGVDLWNRYGEEAKNFIFVSGLATEKYESLMSLSYGCPIYLKKPLTFQKCLDVMESVLDGQEEDGNSGEEL